MLARCVSTDRCTAGSWSGGVGETGFREERSRPGLMKVAELQKKTHAVSVVVPVYNEAGSVASVIQRIRRTMNPLGCACEIIAVDDGSTDGTAGRATEAGAKVIRHPYNMGNGAAVKTGIRSAAGDVIVLLDGDGQHPPEDIPRLLEKLDTHHMAVGARAWNSRTGAHRNLANRIYNLFAGYVCGRRIDDLTSGFRAIDADVAREFVSLLPNTFSYPTTITLAVVRSGYSLAYVPVTAARRSGNGRSKISMLRDGPRFFLILFKIATLFSPMKIFLPCSMITFSIGFLYGLFKVLALDARYGPTSAMFMTVSALMFLIGLVSEQVTQLMFFRRQIADQHQARIRSNTLDHAPFRPGVRGK